MDDYTHLIVLNTWGVINSFGAFQSYYVDSLSRPPSDVAWIGSIQVFLLFFIGVFTGRLTDAGFFRPLAVLGSLLTVAGTMASSVCTQYWQILLAQGVCVGLGNGCLFCPAVAVSTSYFDKRRSIAIGLTACGSATGGVLYPSIVRELLPRLGLAWTIRIIGFLQLAGLIVGVVTIRPRLPPRRSGRLVEWAIFKEAQFVYFAVGSFLCFWGIYFALFYAAAYAREVQNMAYTTSLDLVMIMSAISILGRLIPNYLADRFGALTVFVPTAGLSALTVFSWIAVNSKSGLYTWVAFSGPCLGGMQSMFPAALASLTPDASKQGARLGMMFTIISFAVLTGTPISGALITSAGGRYIGAQVFAGSVLAAGAAFLGLAEVIERRKSPHMK